LKEITNYECEICGMNYQTSEEAQKCEDSHPKIEKGVQIHYRECG